MSKQQGASILSVLIVTVLISSLTGLAFFKLNQMRKDQTLIQAPTLQNNALKSLDSRIKNLLHSDFCSGAINKDSRRFNRFNAQKARLNYRQAFKDNNRLNLRFYLRSKNYQAGYRESIVDANGRPGPLRAEIDRIFFSDAQSSPGNTWTGRVHYTLSIYDTRTQNYSSIKSFTVNNIVMRVANNRITDCFSSSNVSFPPIQRNRLVSCSSEQVPARLLRAATSDYTRTMSCRDVFGQGVGNSHVIVSSSCSSNCGARPGRRESNPNLMAPEITSKSSFRCTKVWGTQNISRLLRGSCRPQAFITCCKLKGQ